MSGKDTRTGQRPHRTRNVQPKHHDTYESKAKAPDSMVCDMCNVVLHGGRWYWGAPPFGEVRGGLCPACRRTTDRLPAGTLLVPRSLAEQHAELIDVIRRVEASEKSEHPLERIMAIEENDEHVVITTTGLHLARRVASKLERLLHVKPKMHYAEENHVRVEWR